MAYTVVVGSGIAGSVIARRIAEETEKHVLVVERNKNIGGYCFDERNEDGILVHRFGPHIFRTESKLVWDYLSRFTEWEDYQHKVLTYVNGKFYPMPINLDTVNDYLGTHYSSEDVMQYFHEHRTNPDCIHSMRDVVESQIGPEFYHAFYEHYTEKQWGLSCDELPANIVARIPIRSNRDDRYFTHKYQALPKEGYTRMIQNMLDHPKIHILLNTNYREMTWGGVLPEHIYYSGPIDEYYNYCYGKLPYRCVRFSFEEFSIPQFQKVAVVNYPNNYDYTRITEFKHFYRRQTSNTVIAKEYPCSNGDPSYPIQTKDNIELYEKYARLDNEKVTFIGRLGEYKYYSMDQVVEKMLTISL